MAAAVDLGVLHALAGALADGPEARECVEWSALCAEEAGLLGPDPLEPLRAGLREALAGLETDAADRCWAEARRAFGQGRISGSAVEEAVAATWQWREGTFPAGAAVRALGRREEHLRPRTARRGHVHQS
ncbi:hypothetical protein SAVIM40S_05354 [Streptomyces avidinii]